jgi:hypothetical protein
MFDWKIMAASFAALLVVSSVLVSGFGFGGIIDTLKDFLGDIPFEGLVTSPVRATSQANVTFHPSSFSLGLDSASFSVGQASFTGFSGTISADLSTDNLSIVQKDSDFSVSLPLTEVKIGQAAIGSIHADDTSFTVDSDSLETSGQNASLDVLDFSGSVRITASLVELSGNVSSVKGNGKAIV